MDSLKNALRRLIQLAGIDVVRARSPGSLEGHLYRLLPSLAVNCVIDVGAHYGEYATMLRHEIGYRGRIVSFEPVSDSFAKLQRAKGHDPLWRGERHALGSENSSLEINLFSASDLNSLRPLTAFASEWQSTATQVRGKETVSVKRLDDVIQRCTEGILNPRVFLKLDTQGYDLEVLKGATNSLEMIVGLQTEVATSPLYEGMPVFPEGVTAVTDLGFEVTGIFTVSRDADWIKAIEYDCVFRRA